MASTRVGIIGLSAKEAHGGAGAWAAMAILPSLQNSPEYEIVALCNSSVEAARRSIEMHKLPSSTKAYGDAEQLANDPDVDLVVVSVVVTKHLELTLPALAAKKRVFVEWPLAASVAEAKRLTQLAEASELKTIVGLQGRGDGLTAKLREIIESGEIGDLLNISVVGALPYLPPSIWAEGIEYYVDIKSGGNMFHIAFGHFLDSFTHVVGDFDLDSLSSILKIDATQIVLLNADRTKVIDPAYPKSSPDHILVQGKLRNGATASLNFRATSVTVDNIGGRWVISGTKGEIEASWGHGTMWQMHDPSSKLRVKLATGEERNVELLRPDSPATGNVQDAGLNTAVILDAFAKGDSSRFADFGSALETHRLLEEILQRSGYKF
ncbi:oxidoreductase family protein [Colletotrichum graminicola]|uniref:Oxidoreductase family protein n=1 Tax=Colletotrichum graminicola (strain M1.001 / M2 / FGSC 10212) TaxID=645133 RepID=E3QNC0_COLGM|nr:oxidoreductase family protein [Colletotrichum graminicola M1.001]EFQ32358.1 oxidoreductase family protein [Colletotrichum graminicola M1.001]WDK19956.1 oxidoreductase family protein [Colletotrichum graminicola]